MEDTEKDKETLKQTINQLEETKRQQEKALEKLNKEVRRRDIFYTFAALSIQLLIRRFISPKKKKKITLFVFFPPSPSGSPLSV